MGETNRIRGYINDQLKSKQRVSLVEVIAKFDFHQHAIPTVKEINRALSGLALVAFRNDEDILLEPSGQELDKTHISEDDLGFLYESYLKALRKRKPQMHNKPLEPTQ